jgi:hypothetical protein
MDVRTLDVWTLAGPGLIPTDQMRGGAFDGALLAHAAVRSALRDTAELAT